MSEALRHVVVSASAAAAIRSGAVRTLRWELRDGGDLARVGGEPGDDVKVVSAGAGPDDVHATGEHTGFGALLTCAEDGALRCTAGGRDLPVTVMPAGTLAYDRVEGIFESDVVSQRSVAVLGLGSGGSTILRELARCGIRRFLLLDHDRLEIGNVSRHESGLADVGRLKVNAMRDLVLDRNPGADVITTDLHIDPDTFGELHGKLEAFEPDLVICATDNRASRLLVNRLCLIGGVPSIYGGVFRRAYGGQVLRVIPGLTPCYQCFVSALPDMAADREIGSAEDAAAIAYSDRPVAVEPGLASDIAPIALHMVRLALVELLDETPSTLDSLRADLVAPLYLWLNRRETGTDYADWTPMATGIDELSILRWYGIDLPRNEHCPACGTMQIPAQPAYAANRNT
ncbi:HesA/MoeB/ThiF family protein [Micromonospora sp. NPDC005203]|uniref:HesA/MoeB/ThiF family protein n=1 Tax=Micromonospora sp. NPDC005203 TaxID=3364226 RepID=UPI0036899F0B